MARHKLRGAPDAFDSFELDADVLATLRMQAGNLVGPLRVAPSQQACLQSCLINFLSAETHMCHETPASRPCPRLPRQFACPHP